METYLTMETQLPYYRYSQHPTDGFKDLRIEALERENKALKDEIRRINHVKENIYE